MKKNRLIIVEGPQGCGKTTLANFLRDNIASSNLFRLSGQKEKSARGKEISKSMYKALFSYLKEMENIPMDLIFDRTFFTEEVYARLGYKEYSFTDVYEDLFKELCTLNYDIYYFSLYLNNEDLYKERLDRKNHHMYQSFSVDSSVKQQDIYQDIFKEVKESSRIFAQEVAMDNFEEAYEIVCSKLNINRK